MPMIKIFEAYCSRVDLQLKDLRFDVDDERICANATPLDYKLEDNDIINVRLHGVGC